MKPLRLDLPYPKTETITPDLAAARVVAPAYASLHGELAATLQYVYHAFYFEKEGLAEYAEAAEGIALCEMQHFDLLGKTLLKLGVDPVYTAAPPRAFRFFNTEEISYSKTPQKMLLDDIAGEMQTIEEYRSMLKRLKNEGAASVISRILLDEQLHLKTLSRLYERYKEPNFAEIEE